MKKTVVLAIDFDGTLVLAKYPEIGLDLGGLFWLSQLHAMGCELVLWTCRTGQYLEDALLWLGKNGYSDVLAGVNSKAPSCTWMEDDPRKIYADIYIGDRALGAPMKRYADDRFPPHFDWDNAGPMLLGMVERMQK